MEAASSAAAESSAHVGVVEVPVIRGVEARSGSRLVVVLAHGCVFGERAERVRHRWRISYHVSSGGFAGLVDRLEMPLRGRSGLEGGEFQEGLAGWG